MQKKLFNRIQELSNVLAEDKPFLKILSSGKDSFGNNYVSFVVGFPNGDRYKEEYMANPYIINEFKKKIKYSPLKAFQYIKKNARRKEESDKLNGK